MPEKQIADEEKLWCPEDEETLSYVFEKIRGVSVSTGIWLFDAQQKKWFCHKQNGGLIPACLSGGIDAAEWLSPQGTGTTDPEVRIILGDSSEMAVSVPIFCKGINRGKLIAAPVFAEYSVVDSFKEEIPDCQVVYCPELAEYFGHLDPDACSDTEGLWFRTVFYLMRGAKRYLENCLRRRNIQKEANILKNDCANAEQEGQEILALIDSFQAVREMPAAREKIIHFISRVRERAAAVEPLSGAEQMEADMIRMQHIYVQWHGKFCQIRTEAEFVRLYLRMKKQMMNSRFSTEIHIPGDCLDLKIPFGTIQSLVEAAFTSGLGSARGHEAMSLYIRRDGNTCRISFSDRDYVLPEDRVRELMNLRFVSDPYHMVNVLKKEACPPVARMIMNLQSVFRDDFMLDILSNEQSGTTIQIRYPCL